MFNVLWARFKQGHRTLRYPEQEPVLPARFQGRPRLGVCKQCQSCRGLCPTGALTHPEDQPCIDLGRCLFCGECTQACPHHVIAFTPEYRLACRQRNELLVDSLGKSSRTLVSEAARWYFSRSFRLRQVSAGGCNACEVDTNALGTVTYDLGRFGIDFVASPRHADGLLVTGPVSENMRLALTKTYEAVPAPKVVIAVGACAISGGPYAGHPEVHNGVAAIIPVDLYVPGCPPHPMTILHALLGLLGRV